MRLDMEVARAAEASTEVRDDDPDVALRDPQGLAHAGPGGKGNLRGAPDRHLPALPSGDHGMRLDRDCVHRVGAVGLGQLQVGLGEAGVDVALTEVMCPQSLGPRATPSWVRWSCHCGCAKRVRSWTNMP